MCTEVTEHHSRKTSMYKGPKHGDKSTIHSRKSKDGEQRDLRRKIVSDRVSSMRQS